MGHREGGRGRAGGSAEAAARTTDGIAPDGGVPRPTKDNIVTAINDVVTAAGDEAERLYFYFSGHGITARVSNRDESALVTPGFDELHTDHSLAIRSLTEYFETTPFEDQFFFIDACRNIPWTNREFEIGRWPIPRQRDPGNTAGAAVHPLRDVARADGERRAPGQGAFTGVLMEALATAGDREGVVVGAQLLRGSLGAAGDVRQQRHVDAGGARRRRAPPPVEDVRSRSRRTRAAAASRTATATRSWSRSRKATSRVSS